MSKPLDEAIKEAEIDRARRFPLLDITDNIEEIREIAQNAIPYVKQLNPELVEPEPWEFLVRIVIEFFTSTIDYLDKRKSTEFNEVYIQLGTLMKVAICYGETREGDKVGTFNPSIEIGKDLAYEFREEPYNDSMSNDMANDLEEIGMKYLHPMFYDIREEMKTICDKAVANILAKWTINIFNPESISFVVVAFFRKAKEWLITHKDDNEGYGAEFNLGRLITMGIEKHADGNYFIYIIPAPQFKMEYAKGDKKTEELEGK